MAAQVLSGTGNVSYTNSTGQNVRLVINYLKTNDPSTMTFQGVSLGVGKGFYGKTLAYRDGHGGTGSSWTSSMSQGDGAGSYAAVPVEIALSNGETFSITDNVAGYNIIVIPEAG